MTAKPWKVTIQEHFQNKTRTQSKGQRNQKSEKQNTNFETVSNQQHHRRQSKKCADGLHTWRPGNKQHRNNKRTNLYPANNGNAIGIQQAIKSKIRYKSDPSGHVINLSKHSFSLNIFKLLNKNLNFVPTPKNYNKKQLDNDAENFFHLIKL